LHSDAKNLGSFRTTFNLRVKTQASARWNTGVLLACAFLSNSRWVDKGVIVPME